ncbi:MAG: DUF732 domain-containing protein [Actinomycetia bacterium]|nr:DUF732 domain-containing protein [Actinomycetes bacterium]MCH9700878.1 DUF732 domain-containing protein [Actinomycetes bacterium]MCH9761906.1 DUF732 domain-containing protein [Actinomycetes bacterium]
MKLAMMGVATVAALVAFATPAAADPDSAFAEELHTYGIYGQRDYNAWIGKITCKRLTRGVDQNAYQSADFVHRNLDKGSTTEQAWQFLAAGLRTYCPDKLPILANMAQQ